MIKPIDVSTIANIATALTVLVATIFGLLELRTVRRERQERAALAVVSAIMTPAWLTSVVKVQALPDNATIEQMENDPERLAAAHSVGIILEALGYSVYKRIVPLAIMDECLGGTVRVAWNKMRVYIEAERARSGSQKSWEWFQWLAEQLERHSPAKTSLKVGAAEAYRDWRP